ncbi:lysine-rich coiled-coil protein 1-like [Dugong dugon]
MLENSKIYDSFQHELEDYIRKQKARGLQPKICFRKVTEDSEYRERGHTGHKPLVLEQKLSFRRPHRFPGSNTRLTAVESQLPPWSKMPDSRQRMEYLGHYQKTQDHLFNTPWLPSPPEQRKNSRPHRAQPREDSSFFFSEDHTNAHQAGDKESHQRRRYREEEEEHIEKEQVLRKRKHRGDGNSHEENRNISKRKAKVDPVSAETLNHRMKNNQDGDTTKEGRRSQREKKGPGRENAEETDLWDDAILGGCY